jgi:uncharacterized protein (TIGR00661 family)
MKVLYAIQGTGNGHISRAEEVLKHLGNYCEFDVLISAGKDSIKPTFPIKFHYKGITMHYNSGGGIDKIKTFTNNSFWRFLREVRQVPVENYDLVINDFEPVSAWACKFKNVPVISLSHQAAYRSKKSPRPRRRNKLGEFLFKWYAPSKKYFGFHFLPFDENIKAPIVREAVRNLRTEDHGFYLIYLPAYSNYELMKFFRHFPKYRFEIFGNMSEKRVVGNCSFNPANNLLFIEKLRTCSGVICGAGFELPSESIYLGKKLLAIPIKGQYEQECNAEALRKMGVAVMSNLRHTGVQQWFRDAESVASPDVPDTNQLLRQLIEEFKTSNNVNNSGLDLKYSIS